LSLTQKWGKRGRFAKVSAMRPPRNKSPIKEIRARYLNNYKDNI